MNPKPGRYLHYKGKHYIVLGVARHSETEEDLVIYQPDYGDRGWWARPVSMFAGTVTVDGQVVPRFRFLDDDSPAGDPHAGQVTSPSS